MNFDRLRQLLIQKAIEGKLVPWKDATHSLPVHTDGCLDIPFSIPSHWQWMKLSEATIKISDGTHHSPVSFAERSDKHPFLYVTAKNIKIEGIDLSSITYVAAEVHNEIYARCNPEFGDILFIKDGATTGVVTKNSLKEPFSLLSSVALLKPQNFVDSDYLVYAMRSDVFSNYVKASMQGTGIPRVTLKLLKNFILPIPPLEEQRRIVARLNELLSVIKQAEDAYTDLQSLGKTLRERILQKAIEGKLVPQLDEEPAVEQIGEAPDEIPFVIPSKWQWTTIENSVSFNPKITTEDDSDVSFLPMTAVSAGYLSKVEEHSTRKWATVKKGFTKFEDGDVLFARITPCFQNLKSLVCSDLVNGIGAGSTEFHVLRAKSCLDPFYLLWFLKSPYLVRYGINHLQGVVGQQRFATKELKTCPIPVPPLAEQRRIVAKLNKLLPLVDQMTAV